jgi:hypothetical protein
MTEKTYDLIEAKNRQIAELTEENERLRQFQQEAITGAQGRTSEIEFLYRKIKELEQDLDAALRIKKNNR